MKKSEKYQERKRQQKARRAAAARVTAPVNVVRIGPRYWPHPFPDLLGLGDVHPIYAAVLARSVCR